MVAMKPSCSHTNTIPKENGDSVVPPIHFGPLGMPMAARKALTKPTLGSRMKTQMSPTRMGATMAGANNMARSSPLPLISPLSSTATRKAPGTSTKSAMARMMPVLRSDDQKNGSCTMVA